MESVIGVAMLSVCPLTVNFAQNNVDAAENHDHVGNQAIARDLIEDTQVGERWRADAQPRGLVAAVADDIERQFAARGLAAVIDLVGLDLQFARRLLETVALGKSVEDLLYLLVDLTSKGVNYLLNVGPTAEGEIPQPSIELLEGIGDWMAVNSEAIHGASPSPFPYEMQWGRTTTKGNMLYLMFFDWDSDFRLSGLRNQVKRAYLLADPDTDIAFEQSHDAETDQHTLERNFTEMMFVFEKAARLKQEEEK